MGCSVAAPSLGPPPAPSRPCTPVQASDQGGWPGALPAWRLWLKEQHPPGLEAWWGIPWKLGPPAALHFQRQG